MLADANIQFELIVNFGRMKQVIRIIRIYRALK